MFSHGFKSKLEVGVIQFQGIFHLNGSLWASKRIMTKTKQIFKKKAQINELNKVRRILLYAP